MAHSFRGFTPWHVGPVASCLNWGKTSCQECVVEQSYSPHGGQEAKEREEGLGFQQPLQGCSPRDQSPPLSPTSSQQHLQLGTKPSPQEPLRGIHCFPQLIRTWARLWVGAQQSFLGTCGCGQHRAHSANKSVSGASATPSTTDNCQGVHASLMFLSSL
jgi:hypothetical protein